MGKAPGKGWKGPGSPPYEVGVVVKNRGMEPSPAVGEKSCGRCVWMGGTDTPSWLAVAWRFSEPCVASACVMEEKRSRMVSMAAPCTAWDMHKPTSNYKQDSAQASKEEGSATWVPCSLHAPRAHTRTCFNWMNRLCFSSFS